MHMTRTGLEKGGGNEQIAPVSVNNLVDRLTRERAYMRLRLGAAFATAVVANAVGKNLTAPR